MQGTFRYPDGSEYLGKKATGEEIRFDRNPILLGEWNEDGQRHGLGQLIFNDQAKYRGRFENGLFAGLGSICYPDGSK